MVMLVNPDGKLQKAIRLQEVFWAAFRAGKDTYDIAKEFGTHEAVVYNTMHRGIRLPQSNNPQS